MRLSILAYGKAGRGPEAELTARYLARIPWDATLSELSDSASFPPAPAGSRTVVLDERGTALSSQAFAAKLGHWRDEGVRETRFLIGPADGHSAETRAAADLCLALGPATWPHLLARAMLAEQLYRAWSILVGHPYHRD
ncbi:23S rRNA (pseudouridine(1915)-N(3))-methyltransferase RlmH [Sandaracinobacter sp. RS1-74]|uniref:23S rRNA (pseudouridine(1915)-N(3))-methyltransferase RlmH n=1 Tax=Sandaracinobacteroides sayramensis TaxID=2913411 RepID=UPI001EDB007D|nr:23S rRNA (pseudouridine(1915)-N(3))-methyltransferase RlmH [Sandaracinobacteroides sayramensis]MCG2842678.1 23S rRNA (pseudouridine(1915)-N(3))-methyltransferase RlmH [Sandaracinobacteroides sayramensis]